MADFDKIPSVLITGATGSLGRALCRFLLQHDLAERICVFSRGEHAQAATRDELQDDPRLRLFIGDVRDKDRLVRAMQGIDLVVHAAALKRIEVARYNVEEAIRTNVEGAVNVVEAARLANVGRVIGISTDKAVFPTGVYGQTKALMENLFLSANENSGAHGPKFSLCRYGNVWCSAGSVVPKWVSMIRAGAKAVPLTSESCTRYYMEMSEAVELVIGTAAHMKGGEIAIPTLPAYRLGDLAEALGVRARVIGLPKWEKEHEQMTDIGTSETAERLSVEFLREAVARYTGYVSK